jgi:hypothetical protein
LLSLTYLIQVGIAAMQKMHSAEGIITLFRNK